MARKFPHTTPRFGSSKAPKPDYHWKDNYYYLWWAYLRRNEGYLKTCEAGGLGEFASLYKDFGDVRADDFKAWWTEDWRGARLFSEPSLPLKEKILLPGDTIPPPEEAVTVCFPLYLSKRAIERYFKGMLKDLDFHEGRRGIQDAKRSRAKYQVSGNSTIEALKKGLEVYDLHKENPTLKLWEIGNQISGIADEQKITGTERGAGELMLKKNTLTASVSRYLKKTRLTIDRTGKGLFP